MSDVGAMFVIQCASGSPSGKMYSDVAAKRRKAALFILLKVQLYNALFDFSSLKYPRPS